MFHTILRVNRDYIFKQHNKSVFVMEKFRVCVFLRHGLNSYTIFR